MTSKAGGGARDDFFTSTRGQIFQVLGGWGNSSGPGLFMFRTLLSGSATAAFTGMTGAVLGSIVWGTSALPFIVCSCLGFCIGTLGWYRDSLAKALICLDAHPSLLRLHLESNYPRAGFRNWNVNSLRSDRFRGQWQRESMLLVSWLTAQPALEQILESEENALIEKESEIYGSPREIEAGP